MRKMLGCMVFIIYRRIRVVNSGIKKREEKCSGQWLGI